MRAILQRILFSLTITTLALLGTGALYQAAATSLDTAHFPSTGQRVDIGGYKLHLNCTGIGSPIVILEAGLGDSALVWSKVQPGIAAFTRVCSYDRAGYGLSDAGPLPMTGYRVVAELHALLMKAKITGPYILVGHSLGGLYVRLFTSTYPREVVGMVLVDPSSEAQELTLTDQQRQSIQQDVQKHYFDAWLAIFGIPRLALQLNRLPGEQNPFQDYPPSVIPIVKAYEAQPKYFLAYANERGSIEKTATEVKSSSSNLGNLPLVVVSHGLPVPTSLTLQKFFSGLSTHSTLIVAMHSTHYIQLEQPDLIIDAVQRILDFHIHAELQLRTVIALLYLHQKTSVDSFFFVEPYRKESYGSFLLVI